MLVLREHTDAVRCVAYCPGRPLLASGGQDQTLKVWDLGSGTVVRSYQHEMSVEALAFNAAGTLLVAGDASGIIAARDPEGDNKRALFKKQTRERQSVRTLCMARTGDTFAVITWNGQLDVRTGPNRHHEVVAFEPDEGRAVCAAFVESDDTLVVGSDRGTLKLFSERRPRLPWQLKSPIMALAVSPDQRLLAAGTSAGEIHLIDLTVDREPTVLRGHTWVVYSVSFTPDGRTLLSGSADGSVRLWDPAGFERAAYAWEHSWVNSVAVSPDGMTAAAACADGAIVMFDLD